MAAGQWSRCNDGVLVHNRLLSLHRPPYPRTLLMEDYNFKLAEKANGAAAIIGCFLAFVSYTFTGQLIPGVL